MWFFNQGGFVDKYQTGVKIKDNGKLLRLILDFFNVFLTRFSKGKKCLLKC